MTEHQDGDIAGAVEAFIQKRDDILRRLAWREYWKLLKETQGIAPPPYDEQKDIALISMHKVRYELPEMGRAMRQESRAWLEVRGYSRHRGEPWPTNPEELEDDNGK